MDRKFNSAIAAIESDDLGRFKALVGDYRNVKDTKDGSTAVSWADHGGHLIYVTCCADRILN